MNCGHVVSLLELRCRGGSPGVPLSLNIATAVIHVPRLLRRVRPQVIHCHFHTSAIPILPWARAMGIPLLIEVHGLYVPAAAGRLGRWSCLQRPLVALERIALRSADHVLVQAESMKRLLVGRMSLNADRVSVLYPGLRVEEFSSYTGPPASIPGRQTGEKTVMYIGSTAAFQGLSLLAAAQKHLGTLTSGVRLVLVVNNVAATPDEVVALWGFDPTMTTVVMPSNNYELPAWLSAADVLVHARPESLENVNVQSKLGLYLASGKPIVTTDVGDYPLLLSDDRGCVLTKPSPEALACGLADALASTSIMECARIDGPVTARRFFSTAENAKRLTGLYKCLAGTSTLEGAV